MTEIYVVTRHRIRVDESKCRCDAWVLEGEIEGCECELPEVRFFDDVIACFVTFDEAEKAAAWWREVGRYRYDADDAWFDYEVNGPIPIGRTAVLA